MSTVACQSHLGFLLLVRPTQVASRVRYGKESRLITLVPHEKGLIQEMGNQDDDRALFITFILLSVAPGSDLGILPLIISCQTSTFNC